MREFSPYLAAGTLEQGLATLVGYGRETFAYPDFPKDIFSTGSMKKEKCCIACGKCADIMRAGGTTGCVVRDAKSMHRYIINTANETRDSSSLFTINLGINLEDVSSLLSILKSM